MQVLPSTTVQDYFKKRKKERKAMKEMWYFPLGSRLQRLFASEITATKMRWHWDYERADGVMIHPCNSEAWKHFDHVHPDFAKEHRNVRLGLCSDGFNPFGQVKKAYSCWPDVLTPHNLPSNLCMRWEFMFLIVLIPED